MLTQKVISDGIEPDQLLVIEDVEPIAGLTEHDAVVATLEHSLLDEQVQEALEPERLTLKFSITAEHTQREDGGPGKDADNGHDHE